jgi:ribonuclease HI
LACRERQGVGIILILPREAVFEQSVRLEYFCTNTRAKYEAILLGLQIVSFMGIKHVEAFVDSLLVVCQIVGTFQCLDGSLNAYLEKCLKIIALFDDFTLQHISRDEKYSGERFCAISIRFPIKSRKIWFSGKTRCSGLPNRIVRFSADA